MLNNYLGIGIQKSRYLPENLHLVSLLFIIVFIVNELNGNPARHWRPQGGLLGPRDLHHHVKAFAYALPCEIRCIGKLSSSGKSISERSVSDFRLKNRIDIFFSENLQKGMRGTFVSTSDL